MDRWFHDVAMAVVELGAWCDSVTEDEYRGQLTAMGVTGQGFQEDIREFQRSASFRVSEFAVLADGRRLSCMMIVGSARRREHGCQR
jgi:hypothetical protein